MTRRALSSNKAWMLRWSVLFACALYMARAGVTHAEDRDQDSAHAQPSIGFVALLRAAQRNVPAVLSALATVKRIEAEQRVAEGAYLPRATGEATFGALYDNRQVLPSDNEAVNERTRIDSTSLAASAGVNLDWAALDLARSHNVTSAERTTRAQRLSAQVSQRIALLAATELYVRALAASALVEDASLNFDRRSQQQAGISDLARVGVRPPVDATRASVETVAAKYVLEMRKVEEQAAFAALAAAVGASPERGLRPEGFERDLFTGPVDLDEASRVARAERPELKERRERVSVQEAAYRAAKATNLPTLGAFASGLATYYKVLRGDGLEGSQYNATGGVYMRWNGGDAQVVRRREIALARISEAKRELESAELSIRAEVVDAAYAVQRYSAQLQQAEQMLEAARATRAAQRERYDAGTASLLELLDAEALEQNARRSRIEATRDYDLARAKLLAACGTLQRLLDS